MVSKNDNRYWAIVEYAGEPLPGGEISGHHGKLPIVGHWVGYNSRRIVEAGALLIAFRAHKAGRTNIEIRLYSPKDTLISRTDIDALAKEG